MSGQGFQKITGKRFALGGLTAFVWRPEGFWISTDNNGTIQKRPDSLINRFANNNYPDREGIAEELENDSRVAEEYRIKTKDYKIKTWPPFERPVPPFFDMESNGEDQDPKDKEGTFSGKNITNRLKLKKPLSNPYPFSIEECAYPVESKTGWFLHEPEHITYLPAEDELTDDRFGRTVAHYILEYTNELRTHAPYLPPLRGEYSPASFIALFCNKLGYLDHENSLYPEKYQSIRERIEKTRQHPVVARAWGVNFFWWMGENLQYNTSIIEGTSLDEMAKFTARSVVDAWIASPSHYPNLVRFDTESHEGVTLLDIGVSGSYFAQTFMGTPFWMNVSNCYWKGDESWQVISWLVPYSRYHKPYGKQLFYKGRVLMSLNEAGNVYGACIFLRGIMVIRVALRFKNVLTVYEFDYENKVFTDEDVEGFTEIASFDLDTFISEIGYGENTMDIVQSLMFSSDGQSAVTILEPRMQQPYRQFSNYLLKLESNAFVYSKESSYTIITPREFSGVDPRMVDAIWVDTHFEYGTPVWGWWDGENLIGEIKDVVVSFREVAHGFGQTLMSVDYRGQTLVTSYYENLYEIIERTQTYNVRGQVRRGLSDEETGLVLDYGPFDWAYLNSTSVNNVITKESIDGAIIYEYAHNTILFVDYTTYPSNLKLNGTIEDHAGQIVTADLRLNAQYITTRYSTRTIVNNIESYEHSTVSYFKVGENEYPSLALNNAALADISIADYENEWIAVISENSQRQHFASTSTLMNLLSSKELSKVSLI